MSNCADLRESYGRGGLSESEAPVDPWALFEKWFQAALAAGLREANAMTLATSTPNARIVLMKGYGPEGITFFTNYESTKGRELAGNPQVALLFFWNDLERQIRLRGMAAKVPREETAAYFRSRPRGSQLGAAISAQSSVIRDRAELEAKLDMFGESEIPVPENWGGYRVTISEFEFWQGRPNRLHDRLRYRLEGDRWIRERLAP